MPANVTYQSVANPVDNTDAETILVSDLIPPVITLLGSNPLTTAQKRPFTDPGACVTDNVDAGLVATVTGTVDTAPIGNYTLTYHVSETAGNPAASEVRTVVVEADSNSGNGGGGGGAFSIISILIALIPVYWRRRNKCMAC